MSALRVDGLRIEIDGRRLVDGVDIEVAPGECVAIVGESGAGKSLTANALLGILPAGGRLMTDRFVIDGVDARGLRERGWRNLRGARVALVSQDALAALDPLRRIGDEVAEPLRIHGPRLSRDQRRSRVRELLTAVALAEPDRRARQRPHELSGGQRQRALIASALAGEPVVLVADEPTTALDATVQARILRLIRGIASQGTAVIFISHDFAAVRAVADRVLVMQGGKVVESGPVGDVMASPRHPHTAALIAATAHSPRGTAPADDDIMLDVQALSRSFDRPAVIDVSVALARGRTLGIVGESGSGKTTLARMIVGVERPDAGRVLVDGIDRAHADPVERRRVQLVHQNPLGALDPRWSIGRSLREALGAAGVPRGERAAAVAALLHDVDLDPSLAERRPHAVSGGQRQRAAIARALAASPDLLVLDEPVSALDPTVRERILALLTRLQKDRGLTVVLISHDLDVIAALADDVVVMKDGAVVERGTVADVFADPRHPFTRELLAAGGTA